MSETTYRTRVAVIGGGTVGARLVPLLQDDPAIDIAGVLVRDAGRVRGFAGWRELVTEDEAVVDSTDLVIDVAGGTGVVADLTLAALARGAVLVSANKAALAERWDEYLPFLEAGRVFLEAAVMAGAPVVACLTGPLRGSRPAALHAVLNGTCNVILSAMEEGRRYEDALAQAQEEGFAEADPRLDVEGIDAAHKVTLLGRLAFDPSLSLAAVTGRTSGVSRIDPGAVRDAARRGRRARLVASVFPEEGRWAAEVRVVTLPVGHALAVTGPNNAMVFTGDPVGDVVVTGSGAGGGPTASSVYGDVVSAMSGGRGHSPRALPAPAAGGHGPLPVGAEPL